MPVEASSSPPYIFPSIDSEEFSKFKDFNQDQIIQFANNSYNQLWNQLKEAECDIEAQRIQVGMYNKFKIYQTNSNMIFYDLILFQNVSI